MRIWQILVFPLSLLYGVVVGIRNIFYNVGIFKSKAYEKPIILVGNLTVGGTGKTPHVEVLNRILKKNKVITAVLSRGYKRRKKGLIEVQFDDLAKNVGDEPKQIKHKFPDTLVVCDGNRRRGLDHIFSVHPHTEVVIMDDGFQHRAIKPSLAILLKDYNDLDKPNLLIPAGKLRESSIAERRADIIIVSKTPPFFSPLEKRLLRERIQNYAAQKVFFSYMVHGKLFSVQDDKPSLFDLDYYSERSYSVLSFSGIADSSNFNSHVKEHFSNVVNMSFSDHHEYTKDELIRIIEKFNKIESENKIIITTEKDAMRLMNPEFAEILKDLPLFYLGISVEFHHNDYEEFSEIIRNHVSVKKKNDALKAIKL